MLNKKECHGKKKWSLVFWAVIALTILFDQISKIIITRFNPEWNLNLLQIHLIKNFGAGFGILQNQRILLIFISVIVIFLIVYFYQNIPKNTTYQLFVGLFLGGTIGNLIDRILKGYVIDFIDLSFWPAFNLADSFITIGVIGLILCLWKERT